MFVFALTFNPRSKATNIESLLSFDAGFVNCVNLPMVNHKINIKRTVFS